MPDNRFIKLDGARLLELRTKLGYSAKTVAAKADLTAKTISALENNKQQTTRETAGALASALECDVQDLFYQTENRDIFEEDVFLGAKTASSTNRRSFLNCVLAGSISALFGGAGLVGYSELKARRETSQEVKELAFEMLFGGAANQYFLPSTDNPYAAVNGITGPTSDAMKTVFNHFGVEATPVSGSEPSTRSLDGSALLFGGPLANPFSNLIMGTGQGSPIFSIAHNKPKNLPLRFKNLKSEETGVGTRPQYELYFNDRKVSTAGRDFLTITSMPNILSREYGVFHHRLFVLAGLHGAGTRAIENLLESQDMMAKIFARANKLSAWQAIIEVETSSANPGRPTKVGDWSVSEISGIDFDKAHQVGIKLGARLLSKDGSAVNVATW